MGSSCQSLSGLQQGERQNGANPALKQDEKASLLNTPFSETELFGVAVDVVTFKKVEEDRCLLSQHLLLARPFLAHFKEHLKAGLIEPHSKIKGLKSGGSHNDLGGAPRPVATAQGAASDSGQRVVRSTSTPKLRVPWPKRKRT
ncbi:hypothetical protein DPEC_G00178550 [Dallia pectoralis]|uniref:Uncharacterized protein n=1 Tax=Dallia pectoralis TaxID=75939 RepID=A0ACC2GFI9_DALPE|nr:hypothetical protein DPEC_G00178550 [Dallia pectoralis]